MKYNTGFKEVQIPNTVGDMIKFLQNYSKDSSLEIYFTESYYDDRYYDDNTRADSMKVQYFKNDPALVITFK